MTQRPQKQTMIPAVTKNLPPKRPVKAAGYYNVSSYQIISAGVTRTEKT